MSNQLSNLPFDPVPFVTTRKNRVSLSINGSDSDEIEVNRDELQIIEQCSSAEFYSSVVSQAGSSAGIVTASRVPQHNATRTVTDITYKQLYHYVCNDDVDSIRSWFKINAPSYKDKKISIDPDWFFGLTDCYGCSIAMAAVTHKSYESLRFLLFYFPDLGETVDNYGNSFHDIVSSINDERINQIVTQLCSAKSKQRTNTSSSQPVESFCLSCNIWYTDPDHESSISHLIGEKREVLEVNPHMDPNNPGYKMMSNLGWQESKGLGPEESGRKHLIKTQLKTDRRGFGLKEKLPPKVTHFQPNDDGGVRDNLIHKRKISLKTESKKKRKNKVDRTRRWEIDLRRSMNGFE